MAFWSQCSVCRSFYAIMFIFHCAVKALTRCVKTKYDLLAEKPQPEYLSGILVLTIVTKCVAVVLFHLHKTVAAEQLLSSAERRKCSANHGSEYTLGCEASSQPFHFSESKSKFPCSWFPGLIPNKSGESRLCSLDRHFGFLRCVQHENSWEIGGRYFKASQ